MEEKIMQDYTKLRDKWLMFEAAEKKTESKKPKGGWNFEKGKGKKEGEVEEDVTTGDVAEVPTKLGKKATKTAKGPFAKKKVAAKESSYKLNRGKGFKGNNGINKKVVEDEDLESDLEDIEDIDDIDATDDAGIEDIESEVAGEDIVSRIQAAYPDLEVMITVKGEAIPEEIKAAAEDDLGDDLESDELEEGLSLDKFLEDDEEEIEDMGGDLEDMGDEEMGEIGDIEGDLEGSEEITLTPDQWENVLVGGTDEVEDMGMGDEVEDFEDEASEDDYAEESFRVAKMAGNFKNFKEALRVAERYLKENIKPATIADVRKRIAPVISKIIKKLKAAVNKANGATKMELEVTLLDKPELMAVNEALLELGWQVTKYRHYDGNYNGNGGELRVEYVGENPKPIDLKVVRVRPQAHGYQY